MKKLLALGAAIASLLLSSGVQARTMTEEDIRSKIVGKRIFLAAPIGGEFPLFYRRDGRVDGTGEALGLGRFIRPTDSGRWWISGNRLCQQWQTWYDGRRMCFEIIYLGNSRIRWNQDNGDTGVARIGQ
jgi:hypothetical protein